MKFNYNIFILIACLQSCIQAFCIYNNFTDGTTFDVEQLYAVESNRAFKKWIGVEGKECCHYQNKDCYPHGIVDEIADFKLRFQFPRYNTYSYRIQRWTGGALVMYGQESKFWAECTDPVTGYVRGKVPVPSEGAQYIHNS